MEGHLFIKEPQFWGFAVWKRRWVVISGGTMTIAKDVDKAFCGRLSLHHMQVLAGPAQSRKFGLSTGMQRIILRASSLEDKRRWMGVINAARTYTVPSPQDKDPLLGRVDAVIQRVMSIVTQQHALDLRRELVVAAEQLQSLQAELTNKAGPLSAEKTKACVGAVAAAQKSLKAAQESVDLELQMIRDVHEAMHELNRSGRCGELEESTVALGTSRLAESTVIDSTPPIEGVPPTAVSADMALPVELSDPTVAALLRSNPVFRRYPIREDQEVPRRKLPATRDPEIKLSMWKLIKDNLGRDFTRISMPVSINEPQSVVQKAFDYVEHVPLIQQAATTDDPYLRLMLCLANAFLCLSNVINRMRKPFNALLGETFDYVGTGVRGMAEQVSHHPPISAYFIEGDDFELEGNAMVVLNISLTKTQMALKGHHEVRLKRYGERLVRYGPVGTLHNIIFGKMYVWFAEEQTIINPDTGVKGVIEFLPHSSDPEKNYQVRGRVLDPQGKLVHRLHGRWDRGLFYTPAEGGPAVALCEVKPLPPENYRQFCFSDYTIGLNTLSFALAAQLPRTDLRFRPDMRAFEHGDDELAEAEKTRLEVKQRATRKSGAPWQPQWFDFRMEEAGAVTSFKRTYWECRDRGDWPPTLLDFYS